VFLVYDRFSVIWVQVMPFSVIRIRESKILYGAFHFLFNNVGVKLNLPEGGILAENATTNLRALRSAAIIEFKKILIFWLCQTLLCRLLFVSLKLVKRSIDRILRVVDYSIEPN